MKLTFLCSLVSMSIAQKWAQIIPSTSSLPSARQGHCLTWTSQGLVVYAGLSNGGSALVDDIWSFDITSRQWTNIASSATLSRHRFSATKIANDEILYFGGYLPLGTTNELWKFNPQTRIWTTLASYTLTVYTHSAVFDEASNRMIVYYNGNLVAYSVQLNTWRTIFQGTTKPPSRSYQTASIKNATREIFLFGGLSGNGLTYYNDLWKYDINANIWTQLSNLSPDIPIGREYHCMVMTSRDDLVIYGGGNDAWTHTWVFNLLTSRWSELTTASPGARAIHRCEIDDQDTIYMYGGNSNTGQLDDLWKLQIYNGTLKPSTSAASPAPSTIVNVPSSVLQSPQSTPATSCDASSSVHVPSSVVQPSAAQPPDISSFVTYQSQSSALESSSVSTDLLPIVGQSENEEIIIGVTVGPSQSTAGSFSIPTMSAESTRSLFTIRNVVITAVTGLALILMMIGFALYCTRNQKESTRDKTSETKESHGTSYGASDETSTTNSSNGTITITNSTYGLAVPGYLLLKYGVSVRSDKEIARCGFGRIMLGVTLDMATLPSSTPVIIKEMLSTGREVSQKEIDSFYQEVSIMAYLGKHKNIATLYGYTETPYTIVMKYYPLGSLESWIYSRKTGKSLSQIFYFALDIAQGVQYMFMKGFCHADLKPQNVLIDLDSSTNIAMCVLTDFGITQIFSDKSLLVKAFKAVNINGASIMYAAPEAILKLRRKEHVPPQLLPKFDVYSYVIVLFELVCRSRGFI